MKFKIKKKKLFKAIWVAIVIIASLSLLATSLAPLFYRT